MQNSLKDIPQIVGDVYRKESRPVFAALIRLLGDLDLAEDAMHDAFKVALEQWGEKGVPSNPRAWLVSTGRFKAIDRIRRESKFDPLQIQHIEQIEAKTADPSGQVDKKIEDDVLRLIFTCCHPALSLDARTALTLREVCDLTTEAVASAFLVTPSTMAQRIVRAKTKIREEKIPFEVPPEHELPDRIAAVLQVVYLVFNEGYYASSGESATRIDLSSEAIRLGYLLHALLPDPEVAGLLSLMLLHESRRPARTSSSGDLILLDDQDRSLWDRNMIAEGLSLVEQAFFSKRAGAYTFQAAIAALHAEAKHPDATDWKQIAGLYSLLLRIHPSPVIELNRAVAIAMHKGPEAGLQQIDAILGRGELNNYHLAHAARAELCRKIGRIDDARASWQRALSLAQQAPERRFIKRKLSELNA
ncbi:RNA polymerase sigma factor [Parapedobacter indicus]|uniref:RNA polymerase sigma-70 factor, ECF subfamily n=1 Tax=Parapedobacter indicus TaxID=1477437 RepID=A0A1I3MVH1_9SPHI|nr:RNA polymerase sigma factor [Parapedobacter indicus]PPL00788.1 RNA polymerase sigma-70 factor (ECF subfamily) [Parapedobacter indicus]SFJ00780.1 RNA polymerase sigma-70 factor, ECF subfamily [Parapedobacter indicus]